MNKIFYKKIFKTEKRRWNRRDFVLERSSETSIITINIFNSIRKILKFIFQLLLASDLRKSNETLWIKYNFRELYYSFEIVKKEDGFGNHRWIYPVLKSVRQIFKKQNRNLYLKITKILAKYRANDRLRVKFELICLDWTFR